LAIILTHPPLKSQAEKHGRTAKEKS